jgi:hypothetical protein
VAEQTTATIATATTSFTTAAVVGYSAAAISHVTGATTTSVTTEQASAGLFFTAHQGDTDDREKNRDAKHNKPIHPQILQKDLQVP